MSQIHPPTIDQLQALAEQAILSIPRGLRAEAGNIVVQVLDFPDAETEREMDLESPYDLLGLYVGVALTERSVSYPGPNPTWSISTAGLCSNIGARPAPSWPSWCATC